jgi:hypothetical protein
MKKFIPIVDVFIEPEGRSIPILEVGGHQIRQRGR